MPLGCHGWSLEINIANTKASSYLDPQLFDSPAQRPTLIDNTTRQPQPTSFRQRSITVRHEDLRDELVRS